MNGLDGSVSADHRVSLRLGVTAAMLAAVSAALPERAAAQVLSKVREEVRTPSAESSGADDDDARRKKRRREHSHRDHTPWFSFGTYQECDDDDDDDIDSGGADGSLRLETITTLLTSPYWIPHLAVGDNYGDDSVFARYPYADGTHGILVRGGKPTGGFKPWSLQAAVEYGDDFDDLSRIGTHLLLTSSSRFGIESQWNYYTENLGKGMRDHLHLGDANLLFRFAQSEQVQMRSGVGLNWLDDPVDTNYGFNFTYGADFFPVRPLVFSSTMDLGTLGEATLFHIRATAGVIVNRFEAFAGYDYVSIGEAEIGGLVGGVRIWF